MNLLKLKDFHYALYSLIIFIAVVRLGDAPIESASSKLTIVLMALLIFGEAATQVVKEFRSRNRTEGASIDA